jgi:RND family efflux transporter MFP subunit
MKIKKIKKRYWFATVVIILVILLVGIRKKTTKEFSTYTVTKTTVSDELLLAGTIDAKERVDLGFATSGRVKLVNFNVGDQVKKGDVIAEIEQNRLAADLTQAQANYAVTKVDTSLDRQVQEQQTIVDGLYQSYISGDLQAYNTNSSPKEATAPVISGTYFGSAVGEYVLDIYSSSANSGYSYRLSGIESETYTAQVNQPGQLGAQGLYIEFTDGDSYGNSDWVVPVPNTRSSTYLSRKTAYENALATLNRITADASNNTAGGGLTRNEAQRNQARAQINAVAAQLGDGKIRAPFDGVIAKNDLEVGEIVNAFTTEIVMFGGEEKELNLNTPEIYINKIQLGDAVKITLDAYEDLEFAGTVQFIDFIDTEVNGVPVYQTDILINGTDDRIRSGMNAKAGIISKQRTDVLAIPAHYISKNDNDVETVLIKLGDFDDAKARIVTTGLRGNEGLVEIISGLNEGDVIVLEDK